MLQAGPRFGVAAPTGLDRSSRSVDGNCFGCQTASSQWDRKFKRLVNPALPQGCKAHIIDIRESPRTGVTFLKAGNPLAVLTPRALASIRHLASFGMSARCQRTRHKMVLSCFDHPSTDSTDVSGTGAEEGLSFGCCTCVCKVPMPSLRLANFTFPLSCEGFSAACCSLHKRSTKMHLPAFAAAGDAMGEKEPQEQRAEFPCCGTRQRAADACMRLKLH